MDEFLYNLHGYPIWRKRADVVAVFDLPQARPLRTLYELLVGSGYSLSINGVQFTAGTLAWSRMFADQDQSYIGGKFEDYLLAHPIPTPADLEDARKIGTSLTAMDSPIYAYTFSFQAIDPFRLVTPKAEAWVKEYRAKTGRYEWATRASGRLRWLDR